MRRLRSCLPAFLLTWLLWGCATAPASLHAAQGAESPPQAPLRKPPLAEPLPVEPRRGLPPVVEDDVAPTDGASASASVAEPTVHPLEGVSEEEIARRVDEDLVALGSMSVGSPSGGRLLNAEHLPPSPLWRAMDSQHAWATRETLAFLRAAISAVDEAFPATAPLSIGDLSAKKGGHLSPHLSHQSGRDADVGFYYREGADGQWYQRATAQNLDVARTWALVRAFIIQTDVELILIDASIQALLRQHAEALGEDADWLESVFDGRGQQRALIRHARGHRTHIHVRFYNPIAQRTAQLAYSALVARGLVEPAVYFVRHLCQRGDTLGKLAKRYDTSVAAIKRANRLRNSKIIAGKSYRIPERGPQIAPVVVPSRRLPESSPSQGRPGLL